MKLIVSLSLILLLLQPTLCFSDQDDSRSTPKIQSFVSPCTSFFSDVKKTVANLGAEVTLYKNGNVYIHGDPLYGGFVPYYLRNQLHDIEDVVATEKGFTLLRKDGRTFTLSLGFSEEEPSVFDVGAISSNNIYFYATDKNNKDKVVAIWSASRYYKEEFYRLKLLLAIKKEKEEAFYKALEGNLDYYEESDSDKKRVDLLSIRIFHEIVTLIKDPNALLYTIGSGDKIKSYPIHRYSKYRLEKVKKIYKALTGRDLDKEPFILKPTDSTYYDENISFDKNFRTAVRIYDLNSTYFELYSDYEPEYKHNLPLITNIKDLPTYQEIYENIDKYQDIGSIDLDPTYEKIRDLLLHERGPEYIDQVRVREWQIIYETIWGEGSWTHLKYYYMFLNYSADQEMVEKVSSFPQQLITALEVYYINLLLQQNVKIKSKVQKGVSSPMDRLEVVLYDDGTVIVYDVIPDRYSTKRKKRISPINFYTGFRTELHDIVDVVNNNNEYLFLRKDRKIILWKSIEIDNDNIPKVVDGFDNVVVIVSNAGAFAGIQENQGVRSGFTLGGSEFYTGNTSKISGDQLSSGVIKVISNHFAFAFQVENKTDTTVVTLGKNNFGGDSSAVADELHGIIEVKPKGTTGFTATRIDGKEISWGME